MFSIQGSIFVTEMTLMTCFWIIFELEQYEMEWQYFKIKGIIGIGTITIRQGKIVRGFYKGRENI